MVKKTRISPLSIILCCDVTGGFGKDGEIPWNISEDKIHFKEITNGGICIMGRRTYEDIYDMIPRSNSKEIKKYEETGNLKKQDSEKLKIDVLLPGRESFVVTSDINYKSHGSTRVPNIRAVINSLDENDQREIFVIGGRKMFIEALTWTNLIYMTIVKGKHYNCDRFFPIEILKQYRIINGKETEKLYFLTYKRP